MNKVNVLFKRSTNLLERQSGRERGKDRKEKTIFHYCFTLQIATKAVVGLG